MEVERPPPIMPIVDKDYVENPRRARRGHFWELPIWALEWCGERGFFVQDMDVERPPRIMPIIDKDNVENPQRARRGYFWELPIAALEWCGPPKPTGARAAQILLQSLTPVEAGS